MLYKRLIDLLVIINARMRSECRLCYQGQQSPSTKASRGPSAVWVSGIIAALVVSRLVLFSGFINQYIQRKHEISEKLNLACSVTD